MSLPAVRVSQSPEDKFREYLGTRPKPQRVTEQQLQLVRHIFKKHQHFEPESLIKDLDQADPPVKVSRATVYRTLTKLVDAGMLFRVEVGSRTFYDHEYGYPQHEHLFCDECEKMLEFQHPAIDEAIRQVTAEHGFQAREYRLVVQGLCQECKRKRAAGKNRLNVV